MKYNLLREIAILHVAAVIAFGSTAKAQEVSGYGQQVVIKPEMVTQIGSGAIETLIDEQDVGSNPDQKASKSMWKPGVANNEYPQEFVVDLGGKKHLSSILFWDSNGHGVIRVFAGDPGEWREIIMEDGVGINKWKAHDKLDAETTHLRIVKEDGTGVFGEMLVYEYTPEQAAAALAERERQEKLEKALVVAKASAGNRPLVETGTLFGKLPLVDEIDAGVDPGERTFLELPKGGSQVETILGQKVRVIPGTQEEAAYFAFRIGEGKLLEPGKAYLLTVEFPEDESRAFHISNRGADMVRGIQTGQSLGDTIFGYTSTNLESLQIPLSGEFETFQQLFWLNDRPAGLEMPRGESEARSFSPAEGFLVVFGQWPSQQTPASKGVAVSRIRLFEVPDPDQFNVKLRLPPEGLPQRRLFYREEMADGVEASRDPESRAVTSVEDWYDYHFRMMNFLGMNTFAKDLLEFGAPQHWDVENGQWYHQSKLPDVWANILPLATKRGLGVLPYYEYAGSSGKKGLAQKGKDLAQPLSGKGDYTHIKWAESKRVDLTDPAVLEEFKHILDLTIVKYKDEANFVGAWLRPRVSQMPISFADPTRERFATEANGGTPVSREDLKGNPDLLARYYEWWNGKRKSFLIALRDHLREKLPNSDPLIFLTAYHSEPAPSFPSVKGNKIPLVTDDLGLWEKVAGSGVKDYDRIQVMSEDDVRSGHLYRDALIAPTRTWGAWEWNHAAPRPDPLGYQDAESILITYPFNREFTVNDPEALDLFRSKSGLAMIRHYPLNENTMGDTVGYFVTDVDRVGSYGMMAEALAVANGDPWYIGYTSGHIYNRPFPDAVRRFNANFLALPALPSKLLEKASNDAHIVVRQIDGGEHGTYFAVVNTAKTAKKNVMVNLPVAGRVEEVATGTVLAERAAQVSMNLEPFELRSLHVR